MATPKRKRAHILTSFRDAGSGEQFTKGDTPAIEAGAFSNYIAAGLVEAYARPPKPATKKATRSRKPRRNAPARAKSAATQDTAAPAIGDASSN